MRTTRRSGFPRRELLRAVGVGLAAPSIPVLDRDAEAAGFPRRVLFMFVPGGTTDLWPTGGETGFTFPPGSQIEPLASFRNDIVFPKGLKRTLSVPTSHECAIGEALSGARLDPAGNYVTGLSSGPSIDQIIARAAPGETRFPTLEVGAQWDGPGAAPRGNLYLSYAAFRQPLPRENSPYKLFDLLSGGPARPAAELARIRMMRQSVLDLMRDDLTALQKRVDASDRAKIESHLTAVRSVESRLQSGSPATACAVTKPNGMLDVRANDNFPTIVKLQSDLVVRALACDQTRVVTLQLSRAFSMLRHGWIGINQEHHPLQHDGSAQGRADNQKIARWYAQQLAYLLGELKKVPEGAGTLLDNTLVVYVPEMIDSNVHVVDPAPVILAGRLGGRLATGRFLDYSSTKPHWNQFLVTVCQAVGGSKVTQVGNMGPAGTVPNLFV